jgi:2-C-methyl-D-erythritol 4-phosphate cytidylyltransferase
MQTVPVPAPERQDVWAVVVAGGSGTRFGSKKQYALLAGRPVLDWSLDAARAACAGVVLVLPVDDTAEPDRSWDADVVVAGGVSRSDSVRAGLAAVPAAARVIAVHDAARPLAGPAIWGRAIEAVRHGADGAVPVVSVTDTIKSVGTDGALVTLDRAGLVAVQTPQAFAAHALRRAHRNGDDATDDAALVEADGGTVVLVPGHPHNLKVTHPADLLVVAALLPVDRAQYDDPAADPGPGPAIGPGPGPSPSLAGSS